MWGKGVLLVACAALTGATGANYEPGHRSTVLLHVAGGRCTGAVVLNYHTILTAEHCIQEEFLGVPFTAMTSTIKVDEVDTTYRVVALDGNDHVLLHVEAMPPGKRVAKIARNFSKYGEAVYFWGSPRYGMAERFDLLRTGRYVGGWPKVTFDMHTGPGDSGGAYYNSRHEVVTINWGYSTMGPNMSFAYKLAFKPEQYAEASRE